VSPPEVPGGIPGLSLRQAEALTGLGQLQETYTPDPSLRRRNARLLWAGIVVGLLGLLPIPAFLVSRDFKKDGGGLVGGLFLAGLFLPWCGWRLRQLARARRVRILVFEEGLARVDGASLLACRWDEIETVQGNVKTYHVNFAPVGSRHLITIRFGGGKQMHMDSAKEHLLGMDGLYQRICSESCRHLFPRLKAAMEAGETVTFGDWGLSKWGLHWGRHVLAWDDAENIDCKEGLRIRNPHTWPLHPWVRLADAPIPNPLVFKRLADHYLRENGRDSVTPWAK
jgi:hypothetical protein